MSSIRSFKFLCFVGALGALSGCAQCAPDLVAVGVSQLTVRNVGAMISLVNADTTCGFESDAVKGAAVIDGTVGSEGTLTLTVTDCEFDLGATPVVVSEDCLGNTTSATGKVTISATRVLAGTLTGSAESPIVPSSDQALTITITNAVFDNFEVKKSTSTKSLVMVSGTISAVAKPRLAASDPASASGGACAIPTPNVTFSDVIYSVDTKGHVNTEENVFDVDIAGSNISAQNGKNAAGDENVVSGEITVFGNTEILNPGEELDPDYVAEDFTASYACTPDLSSPESFECVDLSSRLADGAARLTVKMLGTVAGLIEADTTCGFSSAAVLGAPDVTGTPGGDGSLTFTVQDCTIAFAEVTSLAADCNDVATTVEGSITVSGTKTVSGLLTGNNASPVVPNSDQPATVTLTVVVDGFTVGSTADDNALTAESGTLTGVVRPRTFIGNDTGVCSVSSPNAGFDDVTWTDAALLLTSASGSFALDVDSAALEAANGTSPSGTNELAGTITIAGEAFEVPSDGGGLDPAFDAAAFDASWQCEPTLALPPTTGAACTGALEGRVAAGIAALSARAFGTAVSLVDADTTCGFSSVNVAVVNATFDGAVGDPNVTATFPLDAAGCTIALPAGFLGPPDCNGDQTEFSGTVVITGTKTVTGWRTGDPAEPIVPSTATPATFDLSMTFTDFVVVPVGATSTMTATGTLAGQVRPRVALDPTTGACSVATPNVTFTGLSWTNGAVTLVSDGNTFVETVTASDIDAQSGSDGANTNTLAGTITVSGTEQTLGGPLDPAFVQADFDATYLCAANGSPVLADDATCNGTFLNVLGQGAARLLVKASAVATSVLDANNTCGFADPTPTTAPVQTGSAGTVGSLLFTADAACALALPPDFALGSPDCTGTQTTAGGAATVATATKLIVGFLTGSNPPIFPVTRDAVTFTVNDVAFVDWNVYDELADASVPAEITVNSGTASFVLEPITARSSAASDAASAATGGAVADVFSTKTPVAAISALTMPTGDVTIVSAGKTFNLTVSDVALDAFAGAFFDGTTVVGSNEIAGTITVDGLPVVIAADSPLVDPYSQAGFDSTYSCNPDLGGDLVPSAAP